MAIKFVTDTKYPNIIFVIIDSENKAAITSDGLLVKTIGFISLYQNEQILSKMKELQGVSNVK